MDYRREIDGLRAFAVIPVILFHAGFGLFGGGFVGVDVFFVISGYLITGILISELKQGSFSIAGFYERRARRILPALFVVMLASMPFAWLWLLPNDLTDFSQSLAAVSLFGSNVLFWKESGYFDTAAELKPLLHTWSLGVEEQYYMLFPLFLSMAWKLGKRWVLGLLIALAGLSLALAQWLSTVKPSAAFFLLPTRGWELLVGALVAFYFADRKTRQIPAAVGEAGAGMGLALVLYATFAFNKQVPFPGLYALVPTLGAAFIIVFASSQNAVGRLLGHPALVGIGLISYSTYLWHQPILALARQRSLEAPSQWVLGLLALASALLGYLSWRFVEQPFRNKPWIGRKRVFGLGLAGSLFFLTVGLAGHVSDGHLASRSTDPKYLELTHRLRGNFGLDMACESSVNDLPQCSTDAAPEILLWGDSYAMHLAPGFLASNPGIRMLQATVSHCAPVLGLAPATAIYGAQNCIDGNDRVMQMLQTKRSIRWVVLSSLAFLKGNPSLVTRDGQSLDRDHDAEAAFVDTLQAIERAGAMPVIFSPPPTSGTDLGQCLLKAHFHHLPGTICDFPNKEADPTQIQVSEMLHRLSKRYPVIWLSEGICTGDTCQASVGDVLIYRDTGHLSYEGSAYLGKKMDFYGLVKQFEPRQP